jgi:signal peptidase I
VSSDPYFSGRPTSTVADAPAESEPSIAPPKTKRLHRKRPGPVRNAIEWIVIIGVALLVAVVIKQFLVQAFYIPSESMKSSLNVGDRVLVNKLSYHLHDVHRGDIVVFKRPPAEAGEPAIKDLIKRVIGLPGDTIEERNGVVFINDRQLNEPYLAPGMLTTNLPRQQVPAGKYFVMGDNRSNSKDARVFGPISRDLIVGRAFIRVWPLNAFGFL